MEKIDALNREEFVGNLIKIIYGLTKTKKTASIAMNGQWGCGKSFVLDMLEEKLSVFHSSQVDTDGKYFVFHYNCWQYDYYDEPIMAIVSALQDTIKEYNVLQDSKYEECTEKIFAIFRVVLELCRQLTLDQLDVDVKELYKSYKGEDEKQDFDAYLSLTMVINDLKECLKEIAEEHPILIVVDELDRCLPEYAIKVLERLNHIFYGVENIVVLMAYDETQIVHTVEGIFGQGTDVNNYLRKFVDYRVELTTGNSTQKFFEKFAFYFDRFNIQNEEQFFELIRKIFVNTDIRKIEKCIERINLIDTVSDLPVRNECICAAELIYIVLNDVLEPQKDFVMYLCGIASFLDEGNLKRKVKDEGKERYFDFLKLLRDTVDHYYHTVGMKSLVYYDNMLGVAMAYISKVYESELENKGYALRIKGRRVAIAEYESFKKFAANIELVL